MNTLLRLQSIISDLYKKNFKKVRVGERERETLRIYCFFTSSAAAIPARNAPSIKPVLILAVSVDAHINLPFHSVFESV